MRKEAITGDIGTLRRGAQRRSNSRRYVFGTAIAVVIAVLVLVFNESAAAPETGTVVAGQGVRSGDHVASARATATVAHRARVGSVSDEDVATDREPARAAARLDRSERPAADLIDVAAGHVRPVVVLYGDSLAWEAQDYFVWTLAAAGVEVHTRTFGGTAICDFLSAMRNDAAALRPDAVVIEFSGNALTPCMTSRTGMDSLEAYRLDGEQVFTIFQTARVYLAGSPISQKTEAEADYHGGGGTNDLYGQLAANHANGRYVDAGAAVLDRGRWTKTLPCLPHEPCSGAVDPAGQSVNVVRAPDGAHFCPTAPEARKGVTGPCDAWSSGAFRYGSAMARAVAAHLPS